jgi:hypothetical protein
MLNFERAGTCGPLKKTIKEAVKSWWYNITCIFCITFEVGLVGIDVELCFLGNELKLNITPPYRPIYFPEIINDMFSWIAFTRISEHKTFEIEILPNPALTIGFSIFTTMHMSHPSVMLNLSLILFHINFRIYDGRHWDYENNKWDGGMKE